MRAGAPAPARTRPPPCNPALICDAKPVVDLKNSDFGFFQIVAGHDLLAGVVFGVVFLVGERLHMRRRLAIRLGLGCVLAFYGFVNLFAMYCNVRRSCNTQANLVAPYIDYGNLYLVPDHNSFIALSGQYQHRELLPWSFEFSASAFLIDILAVQVEHSSCLE
jgi:hypothetical protein